MPGGILAEGIVFGLCAGRVPFLIEPIEVGIVIGDPLSNGPPRVLLVTPESPSRFFRERR